MRISNSLGHRVLSLSIILITSPQALAWGNTGHEAVAYVAWQQMTPAARARVIELLSRCRRCTTQTIPSQSPIRRVVADLPAGLSQDDQNLYLFMRAATWRTPSSINGSRTQIHRPRAGQPRSTSAYRYGKSRVLALHRQRLCLRRFDCAADSRTQRSHADRRAAPVHLLE